MTTTGVTVVAYFSDPDDDCKSTNWRTEYTFDDGTKEIITSEDWARQHDGDPTFDFGSPFFQCCESAPVAGGNNGGNSSGGWTSGGGNPNSGGNAGGTNYNAPEGCNCQWTGVPGGIDIFCPCMEQ